MILGWRGRGRVLGKDKSEEDENRGGKENGEGEGSNVHVVRGRKRGTRTIHENGVFPGNPFSGLTS